MKGARFHILALSTALSVAPLAANSDAFSEAVAAAKAGRAAEAVQGFRVLAEERDGPAQFNLAIMYARGQGVPQSDEMALYWGWRARFSGVEKARVLTMYLSRAATPALTAKVHKRLRDDLTSAVNSGEMDAMLGLGRVYLELADPADPELALVWFTIAAALQQPDANTWRDVVARELDKDARHAAQERAARMYHEWCESRNGSLRIKCSARS